MGREFQSEGVTSTATGARNSVRYVGNYVQLLRISKITAFEVAALDGGHRET